MSSAAFVDRIFANLPALGSSFAFKAWKHSDKPTKEGVGIVPTTVDVEAMVACILNVGQYKGNVDFVEEGRVIGEAPSGGVHFYQRIKIPVIGALHHELVMEDLGERDGWRVIAWYQHPNSSRLDKKQGARSDYNDGAWLLRPDAVGFSLSSAPSKSDVGRLKYMAMVKGADLSASKAVQANIECMLKWSRR